MLGTSKIVRSVLVKSYVFLYVWVVANNSSHYCSLLEFLDSFSSTSP
jgi:hypothetical protein